MNDRNTAYLFKIGHIFLTLTQLRSTYVENVCHVRALLEHFVP